MKRSGNILIKSLAQLSDYWQRTDPLDDQDRLLVHRDGQAWGRWMRPSLLVGQSPGSLDGSALKDYSVSHTKLMVDMASQSSSGNQSITSTTHFQKYNFVIGTTRNTTNKIIWGVDVGGYIDTDRIGKTHLFARALLYHSGQLISTGREFYVAGVRKDGFMNNLNSPANVGANMGQYAMGMGSFTDVLVLPALRIGDLSVVVQGRFGEVVNNQATSAFFTYARGWYSAV